MKEIKLEQFFELGSMGFSNPEEHVEKMHDWYYNRAAGFAQMIAATAGSLFVGVIIGLFKQEYKEVPQWQPFGTLLIASIFLTYSGWEFWRLRFIQRDYLTALTALQWGRMLTTYM